MERRMTYVPNDNEFKNLMESFELEFRREFGHQFKLGDAIHTIRTRTRDIVLCQYPELEHCYKLHGQWYEFPYEEQPTAAQLGRKIAGVMYSISENFTLDEDKEPETIEPPEPTNEVVKNARWHVRSEFEEVIEPEKRSIAKPTKTKILADSLKGLKPGYCVRLYYTEEKDGMNDQALLDGATSCLGWDRDKPANTRSYSSTLTHKVVRDADVYELKVTRLKNPLPKRRRNPRGG